MQFYSRKINLLHRHHIIKIVHYCKVIYINIIQKYKLSSSEIIQYFDVININYDILELKSIYGTLNQVVNLSRKIKPNTHYTDIIQLKSRITMCEKHLEFIREMSELTLMFSNEVISWLPDKKLPYSGIYPEHKNIIKRTINGNTLLTNFQLEANFCSFININTSIFEFWMNRLPNNDKKLVLLYKLNNPVLTSIIELSFINILVVFHSHTMLKPRDHVEKIIDGYFIKLIQCLCEIKVNDPNIDNKELISSTRLIYRNLLDV